MVRAFSLFLLALSTSADPLDSFIREQLRQHRVPGAAVAIIKANRIASVRVFGVTNSITRERVTADTAFPVASNGKPVAAWLAMWLAGRHAIDLRRPVLQQARVELPDTPLHRRVTPEHLLTHTSGLGNFLRDRRRALHFAPGERFDYSGVGFMVLQELIEARSGKSLDALAAEALFRPAGMSHTWFGARPPNAARVASMHIPLLRALIPFTLVAAPVFLVLCGLLLLVRRLRPRTALVAALIAAVASFAFLWNRSGAWDLAAWFSLVPALVIALLVAGIVLLRRRRLAVVAVVVIAAVAMFAFASAPIPLLARDPPANAASSLHATASDLAAFMIQLSRPEILDTAEMTRTHRVIDATATWGLGIGVERHAHGRDLWHWGSNPGAKSIMIICPETGDGVVVLTNGSGGSDAMRTIAARVMGRQGCWRPGCAS